MTKWTTALGLAAITATVAIGSAYADKEFFKVEKVTFDKGNDIEVKFHEARSSKSGDQEWITIISEKEPDSAYGNWRYVDDKATKVVIKAPTTAGKHEIRLHQHYPAKSFNVVQRIKVEVK